MIAFVMIMRHILSHRATEVALPDRNQPVEAFFFDRSHESFRLGVRIGGALGDEDHVYARVPQSTPHVRAPLPITIADHDAQHGHRLTLGHRQRPDHLRHEQGVGMRRGAEDLHAA